MTGIGEYIVRVVDEQGRQVGDDLNAVSRTRPPNLGERLILDGREYVVENVIHQDADPDHSRTVLPYTVPCILVRTATMPTQTPPPRPTARDSSNVIPLEGRRAERSLRTDESAYLPPGLVATLVCIGYREQATEYAIRSRVAAELVYSGYGWYVEPYANPRMLWSLSRQARRHYGALDLLFDELAKEGAVVGWREACPRLSLVA